MAMSFRIKQFFTYTPALREKVNAFVGTNLILHQHQDYLWKEFVDYINYIFSYLALEHS